MADPNQMILELSASEGDPLDRAIADLSQQETTPPVATPTPAPEPTLTQRLMSGARETFLAPVKLTGATVHEAGKQLVGLGSMAAWGATFLKHLLDPTDPLLGAAQDDIAQASDFMKALGSAVVQRPGSTAASLVAGENIGKAVAAGTMGPIAEDPYGTLAQLLFAVPQTLMPATAMTLSGASKLRRASPLAEKVLATTDRPLSKIIPKYMWTDDMYRIEAARAGEHLSASALETEPAVRGALDIAKTNPDAMKFYAPALEMSRKNLERFQKAYELNAPAIGPVRPFTFSGRNLELTVDVNGVISYTHARDFSRLPPSVQAHVTHVRNVIDQGTAEIARLGILPAEKIEPHLWSYVHKMYSAYFNPERWRREAMTPTNPLFRDAYRWVEDNLRVTPGGAVPTEQVFATLSRILGDGQRLYSSPDRLLTLGGWSNPANVLLKRGALPPEIEAFLGPLTGEQNAVRLGATLDAQARILANDRAFAAMTTSRAFDGRPLLVQRPAGSRVPYGDYVELKPGELAFGRWQGAYVHPDVVDIIPAFSPQPFAGILRQYITAWKAAHTSLSPQTHINNFLGNPMFGIIGGMNPLNPKNTAGFIGALKQLLPFAMNPLTLATNAELSQAVRLGAVRPGFAAHELTSLADRLPALRPDRTWLEASLALFTSNPGVAKARAIYDLEDQVYRYATYLKQVKSGRMTPEQAATFVNQVYPSYAVSSPAGRFLRGESAGGVGGLIGNPFVSFPLETARIYAWAARERPLQLAAASMLPLSMTLLGLGANGMTLEDYHAFQQNLAPQHRGKTLLPVGTWSGDSRWIDATNIVPGARWFTHSENASSVLGTEFPQIGGDLWGSGPAWTGFSLLLNKNLQTGSDLYDPAKGHSWIDGLKMLIRDATPMPPAIISGYERGRRAVEGIPPRRFAEPESGPAAALYSLFPTFEAKTTEEYERQGRAAQRGQQGEIRRNLRGTRRNPSIPTSDRERWINNMIEEFRKGKD